MVLGHTAQYCNEKFHSDRCRAFKGLNRVIACKIFDITTTNVNFFSPAEKGKECQLICRVGSVLKPKGTVASGTRCSKDKKVKDVCIEGKCRVSK